MDGGERKGTKDAQEHQDDQEHNATEGEGSEDNQKHQGRQQDVQRTAGRAFCLRLIFAPSLDLFTCFPPSSTGAKNNRNTMTDCQQNVRWTAG